MCCQTQFCFVDEIIRVCMCFHELMFRCEGMKPSSMSAYLEITDVVNKHLRYVPVPAYVSHLVVLSLNRSLQLNFNKPSYLLV